MTGKSEIVPRPFLNIPYLLIYLHYEIYYQKKKYVWFIKHIIIKLYPIPNLRTQMLPMLFKFYVGSLIQSHCPSPRTTNGEFCL